MVASAALGLLFAVGPRLKRAPLRDGGFAVPHLSTGAFLPLRYKAYKLPFRMQNQDLAGQQR